MQVYLLLSESGQLFIKVDASQEEIRMICSRTKQPFPPCGLYRNIQQISRVLGGYSDVDISQYSVTPTLDSFKQGDLTFVACKPIQSYAELTKIRADLKPKAKVAENLSTWEGITLENFKLFANPEITNEMKESKEQVNTKKVLDLISMCERNLKRSFGIQEVEKGAMENVQNCHKEVLIFMELNELSLTQKEELRNKLDQMLATRSLLLQSKEAYDAIMEELQKHSKALHTLLGMHSPENDRIIIQEAQLFLEKLISVQKKYLFSTEHSHHIKSIKEKLEKSLIHIQVSLNIETVLCSAKLLSETDVGVLEIRINEAKTQYHRALLCVTKEFRRNVENLATNIRMAEARLKNHLNPLYVCMEDLDKGISDLEHVWAINRNSDVIDHRIFNVDIIIDKCTRMLLKYSPSHALAVTLKNSIDMIKEKIKRFRLFQLDIKLWIAEIDIQSHNLCNKAFPEEKSELKAAMDCEKTSVDIDTCLARNVEFKSTAIGLMLTQEAYTFKNIQENYKNSKAKCLAIIKILANQKEHWTQLINRRESGESTKVKMIQSLTDIEASIYSSRCNLRDLFICHQFTIKAYIAQLREYTKSDIQLAKKMSDDILKVVSTLEKYTMIDKFPEEKEMELAKKMLSDYTIKSYNLLDEAQSPLCSSLMQLQSQLNAFEERDKLSREKAKKMMIELNVLRADLLLVIQDDALDVIQQQKLKKLKELIGVAINSSTYKLNNEAGNEVRQCVEKAGECVKECQKLMPISSNTFFYRSDASSRSDDLVKITNKNSGEKVISKAYDRFYKL